MAAEEIALSIAHNGFFEHETLFAEVSAGETFTVIEGNRRLAAVKVLLDDKLRKAVNATDLPPLDTEQRKKLAQLPVRVVTRGDIWEYVGFKHVNGPQAWESYSKAQYIAWVHNELRVPIDEIAQRIGDQHSTAARLYRALMALRQAEKAGVFEIEDRKKIHFSFSHLYTGMSYPGIRAFLGLKELVDEDDPPQTPVPRKKEPELGELCRWLYGSKSRNQEPVIKSQNPDLRVLDEVLQSKNGTVALRRGLPLRISRDIGRGDGTLFREALVSAKHSLEEAKAKLVTGFNGERDLRDLANDVAKLADSVNREMESYSTKSRS
jgi:hypothetical protein